MHQPTFFSLRGPAKALHQQAHEARGLKGSFWKLGMLVNFFQRLQKTYNGHDVIGTIMSRPSAEGRIKHLKLNAWTFGVQLDILEKEWPI